MKKGDDLKNVFMSRAHRRDIQYHSFTLFIDFMFSFALECLVVLFIGTHGQASYREDVHATPECAMRQKPSVRLRLPLVAEYTAHHLLFLKLRQCFGKVLWLVVQLPNAHSRFPRCSRLPLPSRSPPPLHGHQFRTEAVLRALAG